MSSIAMAKRYLPLYEAKMLHHYDHRYGDYAMKRKTASYKLPWHSTA